MNATQADWTRFGSELRHLRERRGLGLRQMARMMDCSSNTVSRMERGLTAPTPRMVELLADAFEIPVNQLLDPLSTFPGHEPRGRGVSDGLELATEGAIELDSGVRWRLLPSGGDPAVEFREVEYPPAFDSGSAVEAIGHPGCDYGYVISGRIALRHGERTELLTAGDAVALDASRSHRTWNVGQTPAKAVWLSLG